jgi:lysine N6-hydroxylase
MLNNQNSDFIYDVIGIGLGPFNLGLAALLEGQQEINALFFEEKDGFQWHPGMLIEGTTLQVPFLADLVTMAEPTNQFSFLNYLKTKGRLYNFYFYERFHIPRREYNYYCQWVSEQLGSCKFSRRVEKIERTQYKDNSVYKVIVHNLVNSRFETYYSKHLVLGVGTKPYIPRHFVSLLGKNVFHSSEFLRYKDECQTTKRITVIGSGQSAAEIFLELLREQPKYCYKLNWFTRSKGFLPMEYSKLGLEHFSPDYIDYFFKLPESKKDKILKSQDLLYKGISFETISNIYDLLYERSIENEYSDTRLQPLTEITNIIPKDKGSNYLLHCFQREMAESHTEESDVIILATGYQYYFPEFLNPIVDLINFDSQSKPIINRNYTLKLADDIPNKIFIQNGEFHTHGVGAPDLGLGAYRNSVIINTLANKEIYKLSNKNVYQTFFTNRGESI